MKKFIYFESAEGGMRTHVFNRFKDFHVNGWLSPSCVNEDMELIFWADKAKIGDCFEHRLGICVRINLNSTLISD